ncbi:NAD(P)H-hydrate dehydratase [candidate division KSB1 bacterium]|nr:NAD(P)H-hydrate dehydratase [candidate division KSB1 bacterium]
MKVSWVEEMRQMDRRAIEQYGIMEELLMEHAGHAAFTVMQQTIVLAGSHVAICCGGGNNGGDGLVVARKLHSFGAAPIVLMLGSRDKFQGAAKLNLNIIEKIGLSIVDIADVTEAQPYLQSADIIVDAIFGTGLDREVGGKYRDIIELINQTAATVYSLDIPSGIHGDTGQVMGIAVDADYTITFGGPKLGNLEYPGFAHGGQLFATHISFPTEVTAGDALKIATNDPLQIPERQPDAHKGSVGKALFIAGSANYYGAPYFAAMSFLKAGGGLSFLATPELVAPQIAAQGHEIIFVPQKSTPGGSISAANKQALLDFIETVDFVVIGPGMSLNEETQQLIRDLAAAIPKPLLIDGDGITAVAADISCLKKRIAPTILTPHPGEMSRLTGIPIATIAADRVKIVQQTAQQQNAIIVLKGAHTLIGLPDERVFINLSGNPGMATAGSGDVLTGTIAAMSGLGFPVDAAVRMGVFVHGMAGDIAADGLGEDGLVAGNILNNLPMAFQQLRDNFDNVYTDHYGKIVVI